jgi:hypothetical protein
MPNWKKVIVSGSEASLSNLFVDSNVTASIFSGSAFTGSFYGDGANLSGIVVDDGLPDNEWDFNIPDETPINDFLTQSLVYLIDFNNLPLVGTEAGKIGWFGNASGQTQLIPSNTGLYIVAGDSTVGYVTPSGYSGSIVGIGNVMNYSASVDNKWKQTATTGSNIFIGNQSTTGSVEITGSLKVNNQEVVLGPLGWARYDDTQYTTSSAFLVTTGSEFTLPNNGGFRVETHLHSSIPFYNSGSQKIQVENDGDVYMCTVTFKAKTADAPSTYLRLQLDSVDGTPYSRVGKDLFFPRGNDVWHDYHEVFQYYADADFVNNGNRWKIRAYNEDVSISNVIIFIQRTQNHLS